MIVLKDFWQPMSRHQRDCKAKNEIKEKAGPLETETELFLT